jgi:two-component system sensor histidine kinase AlgZ
VASIKQNTHPVSLPSFCNLGVMLRALVLVNLAALAAAFVNTQTYAQAWHQVQDISLFLQPVSLFSLALLCALNRPLARLPYNYGIAAVFAVTLLTTALVHSAIARGLFLFESVTPLDRQLVMAAAMTAFVLAYFHTRSRILSPAVTEARLQALQARIRPHFLFNSINAVMSVVRSDPRRAERALQDMADLFRVLMGDNRELVTLESELNLSWQYLELEQLRLGDRLKVLWHIDKMPKDAMVPPLILQPLLENAVYHGVEPVAEPGEISINIYRHRDQVHLVIKNPCGAEGSHHAGNKMATQNIRERLALHFDAEASMKAELKGNTYQVHITMPYTKAPS